MHTQLARFLVGRGHEVHLHGSLADSDPSLVPGASFHDVGIARSSARLGKPLSALRFMGRADRQVGPARYDAVHVRALSSWHGDIVHVTGLYWDEFGAGMEAVRGGVGRELRYA